MQAFQNLFVFVENADTLCDRQYKIAFWNI